MTIEPSPHHTQSPEQPDDSQRLDPDSIFSLAKGFNTAGDRLRVAMRTGESRETAVKFLAERREQKKQR